MAEGIASWSNAVHCGDAFDLLPQLPQNSVHACVCDPPYGLAFMGRDWDDFEPRQYQQWCERWAREVNRALKPGGHLLAFSGNRTHHRLFTGVEDAGFEIRDTLTWHYGSGFPKGQDIGKAIDKRAGAERDTKPYVSPSGDTMGRGEDYTTYGEPAETDQLTTSEPATDAAKQWDGWKTALKPATEFVVMARKPFEGATVDCVHEHGTGALNVDGCRIEGECPEFVEYDGDSVNAYGDGLHGSKQTGGTVEGRYPSNVVFDETEAERLDREVGERDAGAPPSERNTTGYSGGLKQGDTGRDRTVTDSGGPSRYFYTSKASRSERTENGSIENSHPTVKPQDLIEWLVRLVTREGQIVLDPFAGSGTTGKACKQLGREFVLIEQQEQWADVARARCGLTTDDPSNVRDTDDAQTGLEQFTAMTDGGE